MRPELISMASEILEISPSEACENCEPVPEIDGYYIWDSSRGGLSMLVSESGERLVATSSVGFDEHLEAYLAGRRN